MRIWLAEFVGTFARVFAGIGLELVPTFFLMITIAAIVIRRHPRRRIGPPMLAG